MIFDEAFDKKNHEELLKAHNELRKIYNEIANFPKIEDPKVAIKQALDYSNRILNTLSETENRHLKKLSEFLGNSLYEEINNEIRRIHLYNSLDRKNLRFPYILKFLISPLRSVQDLKYRNNMIRSVHARLREILLDKVKLGMDIIEDHIRNYRKIRRMLSEPYYHLVSFY